MGKRTYLNENASLEIISTHCALFNLVLGISNDQVKRNASFASAIAVHSVIRLHIVTFLTN